MAQCFTRATPLTPLRRLRINPSVLLKLGFEAGLTARLFFSKDFMAKEKPIALPETSGKKADETISGGAFIGNGVLVNCEGEPLEAESDDQPEPPKE